MKVINVHKRIINQPKAKISELIETLATEDDKVWPFDKWPKIKFKDGKYEGARGGHGPIRYTINKYFPGEFIQLEFTSPKGFFGFHQFEINELAVDKTEIIHTIEMITSGSGTLKWILAIRSLHDALLEDLFDKIENEFSDSYKRTEWNLWVKFLRQILN